MHKIRVTIERAEYKYDPTVKDQLFDSVKEAYKFAYSYLRKLSTSKTEDDHNFSQAYYCRISPFFESKGCEKIYMSVNYDSGIIISRNDYSWKDTVMRAGWIPHPESNTKQILKLYKEEHHI